MLKRYLCFVFLALSNSCAPLSQQDHARPAGLYVNGKEFHVGLAEQVALAELADCCKLSPPPESTGSGAASPSGGFFILPKKESPQPILGAIWFRDHKVVSVSRELADNVDTSSDDLVAFMKAFKRSLPEGSTMAVVGVKHEQASNAESDVLTLSLPDGHSIVIRIVTLDKNPGQSGILSPLMR